MERTLNVPPKAKVGMNNSLLDRFFHLSENKTSVRTELLAGVTTFLTMAYILIVNPLFLGKEAGMGVGSVFVATAVASAIGTLLMGLLANYPIALAPGMGLNAYFTFAVVLGMKVPWQTALGAVFLSGLIFFLLTLTKVREAIINAIPSGLKLAVSTGIGLFIAFIGFKNAGIIVADPEGTFVTLTHDLGNPNILLTIFGLIITLFFMIKKVKGGIFYGMIVTAIVGWIFGIVKTPTAIFSMPPSIAPTFLQLDIMGAINMGFLTIVFSFLFVDLFDNIGTLVGVMNQAGFLKDNKIPRASRALFADSIATMVGSLFGTSTVTSYIESSAGVAAGGRTGLTAVFTSMMFIVALFFYPLVEAVAGVAAITSPALIIVGILMVASLKEIEWKQLDEAVPAFLTMLMMPLTFSIATGISVGFVTYPLVKIFAGKAKEVHPIMYVLGILFVLRFIFL
ncbi:NCS2 family permease [Tepidibacillus fermentans]|uniref:AGZA family xanthine/uracil permease-like MFS transporter n=1 Tax=Tepidibacillus fermentans TaxID=1281767 RepID=A0A4R3K9L1_9BACI|nr:NCS2 family permease [Tepidibacillus fermentans]TCS79553.1 AGZA family xanthine/uracil permease-like MFS transporter [Tepidibacillus fermentans]